MFSTRQQRQLSMSTIHSRPLGECKAGVTKRRVGVAEEVKGGAVGGVTYVMRSTISGNTILGLQELVIVKESLFLFTGFPD